MTELIIVKCKGYTEILLNHVSIEINPTEECVKETVNSFIYMYKNSLARVVEFDMVKGFDRKIIWRSNCYTVVTCATVLLFLLGLIALI